MMKIAGALLACVALAGSTAALAQSARQLQKSDGQNLTAEQCKTVPANLLSGSFAKTLAPIFVKDEYETTVAYDNVVKSLFPDGTVAATFHIDGDVTKYNADTGTLIVPEYELPVAQKFNVLNPNFFGWFAPLATLKSTSEKYVGENAFGAQTTVTAIQNSQIGIAWKQMTPHFNPDNDIGIPMPPSEAKDTRAHLSVLIIGDLSPPYVLHGGTAIAPTIDNPVDALSELTAISVSPVCAAIFDERTQKVFVSWAPATGYKYILP